MDYGRRLFRRRFVVSSENMESDNSKIPGIPFTYTIKGAEMFVSSRAKSITRSTILYAYHKVKGKEINGPKAIGVHGDSYIYAVFKEIGVI